MLPVPIAIPQTVAADYSVYISVGWQQCNIPTTTVVFYAKPNPVISAIGDLNICATGSVKLKVGKNWVIPTNGIRMVQWSQELLIILMRQPLAGTYYVNEVNTNGCSKSSASVIVTSTCKTGNEATSGLSIMPNPSDGNFMVLRWMPKGPPRRCIYFHNKMKPVNWVENESVHFTNANIEWEMNSDRHHLQQEFTTCGWWSVKLISQRNWWSLINFRLNHLKGQEWSGSCLFILRKCNLLFLGCKYFLPFAIPPYNE